MTNRSNIRKPKRIDQIAFYGVRSPDKLAELLNVSRKGLEDLAANGSRNYRQFKSKDTGRWIETPLPPLKRVQRRIHQLLGRAAAPAYLHSGFRKVSAVSNAEAHLPNASASIVKVDLRKFYPSSDGRRVFAFFRQDLGCSEDVAAILFKLCTIRKTPNADRPHLPTGGVTSPILAYFCYRDLFDELEVLAVENDTIFSLMADDITFSGEKAPSLLKPCLATIFRHGLRCNYKKLRVLSPKHANKKITGCLVTPKGLRVPKERKDRIVALRRALRKEPRPRLRAKLWQQYHGSLASAGQIEPRFSTGAHCAMLEWKADKLAWHEHLRMSGSRKTSRVAISRRKTRVAS